MSDMGEVLKEEARREEVRPRSEEAERSEADEEVKVFVEGLDVIPAEPTEDDELPEEYRGLNRAQLVAQIKKNEQAARDAGDNARSIKEAIAELGKTMRPQVVEAPQPVASQAPQESDEAYEERIKEELLTNPRKVLDEHLRRSVSPLVNSVASGARQTARELVRLQRGPESFDKYSAEIDRIVSAKPISDIIQRPKEVYEEAYNQVMASHLDDLIAIRVAEEVAKLRVNGGTGETSGASRGSVRSPYGAASSNPAPKERRVVLSERDRQIADQKGLDYQTYARIYKGA